jgi:hypothetical protein
MSEHPPQRPRRRKRMSLDAARPGLGTEAATALMKAPARAKRIMPSWVDEQLTLAGVKFTSLYEPFAGQSRFSQYFKRHGKRVVSGDLLESHYCHALALVENNGRVLPPTRMAEWLQVIRDPAVATRFGPWANQHFTAEETIWLGIWNAHLGATPDPVERALGAVAVCMTMQYWLSFDSQGSKHKPMTPGVAFQHYLQTVNTWVCSSQHQNQALWGDAYHLVQGVAADLLFCYPPTDQGFFDYPEPLHLFECWVKGDPELVLPGLGGPTAGLPTLGLPLSDPSFYADALRRFLARAEHFPVWAIAFNDRYPLEESAMVQLVKEFRPILRRASFNIASGEREAQPGERLLIAQSQSYRRASRKLGPPK